MTTDPDALQRRMDRLKDGLRRAGVKLTHQRLEIFQEVAKSGDHPDAETIFKGVRQRLPTVSLDTVYRTLWLLVDLGLLSTLGSPRERVRFDANMSAHHHYICGGCGMTRDFYCETFDHLTIPNAVKRFGTVEIAQVAVRGFCRQCSGSKIQKRRAPRREKEK